MSVTYFIAATIFLIIVPLSEGRFRSIVPTGNGNQQCQPLNISACSSMGYATTSVPNFRNHQSQYEAEREMSHFEQLVQTNCSSLTLTYLCSFYAPFCSFFNGKPIIVKPCRVLCETVRDGCTATLRSFNFQWPDFFNCSLSSFADGPVCFGPPETQILPPTAEATEADNSASTAHHSTSEVVSVETSSQPTSIAVALTTAIGKHFTSESSDTYPSDDLTIFKTTELPRDVVNVEEESSSVISVPQVYWVTYAASMTILGSI